MNAIKHVFFDLDRTLWDLERNSQVVLEHLIETYGLEGKCKATSNEIIKTYKQVNKALWQQYNSKKIDKNQLRSSRFTKTLASFDYHFVGFGTYLEKEFMEKSPYQSNVIDGAFQILDYLKDKYSLYILTNGFSDVQNLKLKNSNLSGYFKQVFISEEIGFHKPDPQLFEYVMEKTGAKKEECLMVGDDENCDILGAIHSGWKAIRIDHEENKSLPYPCIQNLAQLKDII